MDAHKYRIGQKLRFSRTEFSGTLSEITIERLLPADRVENQYQVRSPSDGRRWVVRESDIGR